MDRHYSPWSSRLTQLTDTQSLHLPDLPANTVAVVLPHQKMLKTLLKQIFTCTGGDTWLLAWSFLDELEDLAHRVLSIVQLEVRGGDDAWHVVDLFNPENKTTSLQSRMDFSCFNPCWDHLFEHFMLGLASVKLSPDIFGAGFRVDNFDTCGPVWWTIEEGSAKPHLRNTENQTMWLHASSQTFCAGGSTWAAVASIAGNWIARVNVFGLCTVHCLISGNEIGRIESCGCCRFLEDQSLSSAGEMQILVEKNTLLISNNRIIDIIEVAARNSSPAGSALLSRLSMTDMLGDELAMVAGIQEVTFCDSLCAAVVGDETEIGWSSLSMYSITDVGIDMNSCANVPANKHTDFGNVFMTPEQLISLEFSWHHDEEGAKDIDGWEVVIRSTKHLLLLHIIPSSRYDGYCPYIVLPQVSCRSSLGQEIFRLQLATKKACDEVLQVHDKTSLREASLLVVQEIEHNTKELPALIPPIEAATIVAEQWATHVSQRAPDTLRESPSAVQVKVLTFGRHPQQMDTALRNSTLGRRATANGAEIQPRWAGGAKILVPGLSGEVWQRSHPGLTLRPFHVVISVDDEEEVMECLQALPRHVRPRLKPGAREIDGPDHEALFQDLSESGTSMVVICSNETQSSLSLSSPTQAIVNGVRGLDVKSHSSTSTNDDNSVLVGTAEGDHAWLEAIEAAARSAPIFHLNIERTFIHDRSFDVSPRSDCTESAPGDLGPLASPSNSMNPRLWGRS